MNQQMMDETQRPKLMEQSGWRNIAFGMKFMATIISINNSTLFGLLSHTFTPMDDIVGGGRSMGEVQEQGNRKEKYYI
jgi:hypothetical protein